MFRDIGVSKVQNLPLAPWKRTRRPRHLHPALRHRRQMGLLRRRGAGRRRAQSREAHVRGDLSSWSKAAARPRSGSKATTSATCSNGRRARCSRFRSTPGTASSTPSSAPALLLGGTTAPNLMNLINNVGAIFDCPYQFRDRFSGADDFYKYKDDIEPDPVRGLAMRRTNFIPDIVNCDLPLDNRRSPGFRRVEPFMTGNTFYLWIGQHENGRYSKAHAHTSAAVLICIKGKGYTYTWPERAASIRGRTARPTRSSASITSRSAWSRRRPAARAGSTSISAPRRSRCGSPPGSARTIPAASPARPASSTSTTPAMDIPEGGTAIPYWMEDPFIAPGIRRAAEPRGRREPHAGGILRARLQGPAAEGMSAPAAAQAMRRGASKRV